MVALAQVWRNYACAGMVLQWGYITFDSQN